MKKQILLILTLMIVLNGCSSPTLKEFEETNKLQSTENTLEYADYLLNRKSISPVDSSIVSAIYLKNIFEEEKKQTELLQKIVNENK